MPVVNRRQPLVPANMRAADVAARLTESIAPMQQARTISAFRVQGFQCILYNRLQQGRICPCSSKSATLEKLSPDGKASTGAINRVLTGNTNFGISDYNPQSTPGNQGQGPTAASNMDNPWLGDLTKMGDWEDEDVNVVQDIPGFADNGQHSPDLDDIFGAFDLTHLGLTDVSCPICFGSNYIGGYSVFRGFRNVLVAQDFQSTGFIDVGTWSLGAGTHKAQVVLPRGVRGLDAFRVFNDRAPVQFKLKIDGVDTAGKSLLQFFDGGAHVLEIQTTVSMTHLEIQGALSTESVYFEFPRKAKSGDISFLEKTEPFQLLLSPDVPHIDTLDIVIESQQGMVLVVGTTNPWETGRMNPLGLECQVRVAQPQELWHLLPARLPLQSDRPSHPATPSKSTALSGVGIKSFKF